MRARFLIPGALAMLAGCGARPEAGRGQTAVVYASEDQVFSEPILKDFEKETGIQVRAVFDTEEAKSTGVMNRLLAWISRAHHSPKDRACVHAL